MHRNAGVGCTAGSSSEHARRKCGRSAHCFVIRTEAHLTCDGSALISVRVCPTTNLAGVAADPVGSAKEPPARLYISSGTVVSGSGAPIDVRSFLATIQDGHAPGKPADHQEKVVTIVRRQAFISNDSLGKLLNDKLRGRDLEDLRVSYDKGRVKITGKAKKAITLPFTIEGPVSLTPNGFILLKTETMKVGKLPGLAELVGVNPEKMAGDGSVKGVQASKDSISFDPDLLWGLPVHGKVSRIALVKNGLLLVFGSQSATVRDTKLAGKARE